MTAAAWCARPAPQGGPCGWSAEDEDVAVVDLAARRHTGERGLKGGPPGGHATVTALDPQGVRAHPVRPDRYVRAVKEARR